MRNGILMTFLVSALVLSVFVAWVPDSVGSERVEVIYVGDPMCSWCYGFTPEFSKFYETYGDSVDFRMLMGGLRPYTTHPWTAEKRQFLRAHWQEISDRTGQPFSFEKLNNAGFVYDTERAARAVVIVQEMSPENAYGFFKAVQHAFYAENKDTGDVSTYVDLVPRFGLDPEVFAARYESDEYKDKTRQQFDEAGSMGATSFPTLLIRKGDSVRILAKGYTTADVLGARLEGEL
jgi:putative protein-disulfide isomerase